MTYDFLTDIPTTTTCGQIFAHVYYGKYELAMKIFIECRGDPDILDINSIELNLVLQLLIERGQLEAAWIILKTPLFSPTRDRDVITDYVDDVSVLIRTIRLLHVVHRTGNADMFDKVREILLYLVNLREIGKKIFQSVSRSGHFYFYFETIKVVGKRNPTYPYIDENGLLVATLSYSEYINTPRERLDDIPLWMMVKVCHPIIFADVHELVPLCLDILTSQVADEKMNHDIVLHILYLAFGQKLIVMGSCNSKKRECMAMEYPKKMLTSLLKNELGSGEKQEFNLF